MDEQIYLSTPLLLLRDAAYGRYCCAKCYESLRALSLVPLRQEDQIYYSVLAGDIS